MSFVKNLDIRAFQASVAVAGRLIVAAAAAVTAETVRPGAAATDSLLGISERVGADAGDMLDVIVAGQTEVIAGGNLSFNDPVTANASGHAVKAVAVAGQTVHVVGFIRAVGVSGDILPIHVAPSLIVTPA